MTIRPATRDDADAIWRIFHAVVAGGDTYTFLPDTPAIRPWTYFLAPGIESWVIEDEDRVIGMYKLIPNHSGLGSHVANASFMVDPSAHGKGAGRAMGDHCLDEARQAGYEAHAVQLRRQHQHRCRRRYGRSSASRSSALCRRRFDIARSARSTRT